MPLAAAASDFSGVMTIAFGIPALGLGCLLGAGFFMARTSPSRKRLAAALLAPIWGVGVWLIPDALSLRRFEGEASGPVLFFGLLALLTGLIAALLLRRPPPGP